MQEALSKLTEASSRQCPRHLCACADSPVCSMGQDTLPALEGLGLYNQFRWAGFSPERNSPEVSASFDISTDLSAEKRSRLTSEAQALSEMISGRAEPELTPEQEVDRLMELNPAAAESLKFELKAESIKSATADWVSKLAALADADDSVSRVKRSRLQEQINNAQEKQSEMDRQSPMMKRDAAVKDLKDQASAKREEAARAFDPFHPEASQKLEAEATVLSQQAFHYGADQ